MKNKPYQIFINQIVTHLIGKKIFVLLEKKWPRRIMEEERKFRAALNVIQRLPKSGSFQPSNEMKLGFYAHFKQATRGPCTQVRKQNGGEMIYYCTG